MLNRQHLMPWLNWGMATTYVFFQFFLQATAGLMASKWSLDFQLSKTQVGSLSALFSSLCDHANSGWIGL